ncbi:hypothetical protein F5Y03DRAFT_24465 [Xylaria venustula]|nr:hypothetical protein F5Y03DRAFT_24465 [Xylaria venustula]
MQHIQIRMCMFLQYRLSAQMLLLQVPVLCCTDRVQCLHKGLSTVHKCTEASRRSRPLSNGKPLDYLDALRLVHCRPIVITQGA